MSLRRVLVLICAFFLTGCQHQIQQHGLWRGVLTLGGGKQLPFQFSLDLNFVAPTAYFINGTERTSIPEIRFRSDSLSFLFSEYGAAMHGRWNGVEWRGKFFRYRTDTSWNDFIAVPQNNGTSEIPSAPPTGIPLVGTFRVNFSESKEDSTTGANFWVKNDSIFGTFIAPDGDYGLFAGTQRGSQVTLTRFTGWQAFLLELDRQGIAWQGSLATRTGTPVRFTLDPAPTRLLDTKPPRATTMKNPKAAFTFMGISSTGSVISSDDIRFKNKAMIIDIMGTWCHNCMDAAPLLQQIYSEYGKEGLEVIGLAFELSDNPDVAKKNLDLFKKRYGITYTVLFCGSTKEVNVGMKLRAQLNDFSAYPTTLFIDKKGSVKEIHLGFHGPGTGEEYQKQIQQYYELVKMIVK